jgi:hypothetical protein
MVGGTTEGATIERVAVVAPGPPVAVQLRAAGSIQVTVSSFAGVPARLEVYDSLGARYEHPLATQLPLEDGRGIVPNLPVGTWLVRAVAEDGRVAEATAVVAAGAMVAIEMP